ncbi:hypothetical protein HGRIS_013933 [Hohenbuehelia grisea]|uniref:DUF5648 domain-containing protein n=1 Tax=Hohenbuehelia grisea TaxID=104357 RepID=A0ABR3JTY9_9AGAR
MQFNGPCSVVGTMWKMEDNHERFIQNRFVLITIRRGLNHKRDAITKVSGNCEDSNHIYISTRLTVSLLICDPVFTLEVSARLDTAILMRFLTSLPVLAFVATQAFGQPAEPASLASPGLVPCAHPAKADFFYRLFNPEINDHFYTRNATEADEFAAKGYEQKTVAGYIFTRPQVQTKALFRLYSAESQDHVYADNGDARKFESEGYVRQGVAGFVYTSSKCAAAPLFRLYNPTTKDHFYTTLTVEINDALGKGYERQGILAFAYPFAG